MPDLFFQFEATNLEKLVYRLCDDHGKEKGLYVVVPLADWEAVEQQLAPDGFSGTHNHPILAKCTCGGCIARRISEAAGNANRWADPPIERY